MRLDRLPECPNSAAGRKQLLNITVMLNMYGGEVDSEEWSSGSVRRVGISGSAAKRKCKRSSDQYRCKAARLRHVIMASSSSYPAVPKILMEEE